jgi:signal peptidase I
MDAEAEGREHQGPRWLKRGLQGLVALLLFVVGALVIIGQFGRLTMHAYRIPSSAMEPTLHCARPGVGCEADTMDRVFVPRFLPFWTPTRGDIVVFETPPAAVLKCGVGGTFVKRLTALPGETWEEREGVIYINGKRLIEPHVKENRRDSQTYPPRKIPEGRYFFMGDNRSQSCDSRTFGSVPRDNLVGPVVAILWPPNRIGPP